MNPCAKSSGEGNGSVLTVDETREYRLLRARSLASLYLFVCVFVLCLFNNSVSFEELFSQA